MHRLSDELAKAKAELAQAKAAMQTRRREDARKIAAEQHRQAARVRQEFSRRPERIDDDQVT